MNKKWANRFQCTEFTDKEISADTLNSILDIINYIPEPPPGRGWNRVLWFLLDKSNSKHRKMTEYLVENIHSALQRKDFKKGLVENFGMLLQAPYVLHGAFVRLSERFPDRSALSDDSAINSELANASTTGMFTVADLKQYENLMFHTGSICTKIVDQGLDCCFIGANKGRFLNFPKIITNEEERNFTNLVKEVFPSITENPEHEWHDVGNGSFRNPRWNVGIHEKDNICPGLSIGFGHGVKHTDPEKIITDGKYQWFAFKDRRKLPNLFK